MSPEAPRAVHIPQEQSVILAYQDASDSKEYTLQQTELFFDLSQRTAQIAALGDPKELTRLAEADPEVAFLCALELLTDDSDDFGYKDLPYEMKVAALDALGESYVQAATNDTAPFMLDCIYGLTVRARVNWRITEEIFPEFLQMLETVLTAEQTNVQKSEAYIMKHTIIQELLLVNDSHENDREAIVQVIQKAVNSE